MPKEFHQEISKRKERLDSAAWMNQSPHPLPLLQADQQVHVYRQSRWLYGKVIESSPNGCIVEIVDNNQVVNVYDARCLKVI